MNGFGPIGRWLAGGLALWALLGGLGKIVRIAPGWPRWGLAAILLGVAACLRLLYGYEMRAVGTARARRLVALRMVALGLLAWILLEPTFVRTVSRKIEREVVVLLDESASMKIVDDGQEASRFDIATAALEAAGVEEKLAEHVRVRTLRFARSAAEPGQAGSEGWDQATDVGAALATVIDQVPPEQLAGALLVSDGRHNRPTRVEDSARRFGILDAPVGVLAVGDPQPPRDAAVLSVRSPEAVHLGDKMRIDVELKFDNYKGEQAVVRLQRGTETVEDRVIKIPQDHHREELRFVHLPEEGGVGGFRVEIDELDGERFPENNGWSFETSITEARTHVLLVDSYPRWEFRYLRNLFYGRDKSVQLQWVLTNPDGVTGREIPDVAASAGRPFGDAAATRLPRSENEWRKFDVIILGDLAPEAISDEQWEIISKCVNERAALLVMIAGPQFMPHALRSGAGRELLPVEVERGMKNYYGYGSEPFRFGLTVEGRRHPVTRHGGGESATEQLWGLFPPLRWRHPVRSLREGAEVLLTADDGEDAQIDAGTDLNEALGALVKRRQKEAERALLVTRQTGRGKVALLLTDRTWRLREGAGDMHHHRFWGNLVRWGAGPLLRAGTERVGLGTDRLDYTADDKIKVTARLRAPDMSPVSGTKLYAEFIRDGEVVVSVPLVAQEGSPGLHEAVAGPFADAGRYQVRLRGQEAASLLEKEQSLPEAGIRVVTSRGPVELAETTLNRPLLDEIATASGGKVVGPQEAGELVPLFLGEDLEREEIRETSLWDNGLLFALLALVLTAEWWIRRNGGLP